MKTIVTDKYNNYKLKEVNLSTSYSNCKLLIDKNTTYQTWIGFGGAFTEASAYNLKRVSEECKTEALNAYFDKDKGLGYTLGRMSMGSSDFSLLPYDYVKENDESLSSFNISREDELVLPLYKEASKVAGKNIDLLISPWSPSSWMKDNNSRIRGGRLLPKYYDAWSNYFIKFIDELKKRDVSVFAATVQNEPAAIQRWDSCIYSPLEEAEFAINYLGPKLKKIHPDVDLYVWDHNRDIVIERVSPIYKLDKSHLVKGTAIHWYDNEPYENLTKHHELFPDRPMIHTEGCFGHHDEDDYSFAERYARNIMFDMNNNVTAFIDWNLYLDETGGPNWVSNLCDSPVWLRVNWDVVQYKYSYFGIGQFSKYIRPGALRIKCEIDNSDLNACAFKNTDGSIVIVILNQSENDYSISVESKSIKIFKKSITTVIL